MFVVGGSTSRKSFDEVWVLQPSCPPGTYNKDLLGECIVCPIGYHSNTYGASVCTACGPGTYAPGEGTVNCTM